MCRFLMVKSREPVAAESWLEKFAAMAEASRAPDGDRQADGWGVSWLDGEGRWRIKKSVRPIWTDSQAFKNIPDSRMILAHARSASFPAHKNVLDFNQPFANGRYAFVFNGLLRGVSLPAAPGAIGALKIWNLLLGFLRRNAGAAAAEEKNMRSDAPSPGDPPRSYSKEPSTGGLKRLVAFLESNVREISALNIGLCDGERLHVYCRYASHPEYYHLCVLESPGLTAVCSEPLDDLGFRPVPAGEIRVY